MTLNIASYSEDWRARLLSTFAHTPFALRCGAREIRCESVEGFWQGLKFPEGSGERERVFALWGFEAKRAGASAPTDDTVVFCGERVQLGSPELHALAEKAMRAKLEQNTEVRRALVETVLHGDRAALVKTLDDSILGLRPAPTRHTSVTDTRAAAG